MRLTLILTLALSAALAANGQTATGTAKTEFDVASIRTNAPETGFHFASGTSTGGPGTSDPGMFRCSKCTLAVLISKAFQLQNYQFPAMASLAGNTFEVAAKIPAGATAEEFQTMLQNLIKERFGLAYHFTEKKMRGYQLVVARNGSKLKESTDSPRAAASSGADQWHRDGGSHNGVINFNGSARYRGDHQTAADLARIFSDQLSLPVNDATGLPGKYDVSLAWSGSSAQSASHSDWGGGGGHMEHGGGAAAPSGSSQAEPSGPTLFDAVQSQLGLRLVQSEQIVAQIFVIDHVQQLPTDN